MGPIGCPETSIRNYHYLLRNGPEERSSYLLRDGILKSVNVRFSLFTERTDSCLMYLGMVEGFLLLIQLWRKRVLLTCGAPLNLNTAVQGGRHEFKICTEKKMALTALLRGHLVLPISHCSIPSVGITLFTFHHRPTLSQEFLWIYELMMPQWHCRPLQVCQLNIDGDAMCVGLPRVRVVSHVERYTVLFTNVTSRDQWQSERPRNVNVMQTFPNLFLCNVVHLLPGVSL
jgi:hypothetical protein